MKKTLIIILALFVIGGVIYFLTRNTTPPASVAPQLNTKPYKVIGTSVDGREIQAYRFGAGGREIVYVGGLHGGYEWNTVLLSYELIDYLTTNPSSIPSNISVVVIPVANPDGLAKVVGTSERFNPVDAPQFDFADEVSVNDPVVAGRFNANGVDINRNFDCNWQSKAIWRTNQISAGTAPFSEPESSALRDFFLTEKPVAVIFFHSASNGVYTSFCDGNPLPGTVELLATYSKASGYARFDDYPYYEVTGDAADWLATQGIPAISVEMRTHDTTEWEKNLVGIEAMFALYSK
jgi:predicted deacylase